MTPLRQRLIATESDTGASGVITYWSLSGSANHATMLSAWVMAGMNEDDFIKPVSALVALRRAVEEVGPAGCLVKPLEQTEEGYTCLIPTQSKGKKQTWQTIFSAFITQAGKLDVWVEDDEVLQQDPRKLAGHIEDQMMVELGTLRAMDISMWLVKMADRVRAVSLRESGGFYFIPKGVNQDMWERTATVLAHTSAARIMTIPAMHSHQATLAVVQALTDEISASTKSMQEALDAARMGKRALDTKIGTCADMIEKIDTYEGLLGAKMTEMREAVDTLRAKYVEAWVVADAKP